MLAIAYASYLTCFLWTSIHVDTEDIVGLAVEMGFVRPFCAHPSFHETHPTH